MKKARERGKKWQNIFFCCCVFFCCVVPKAHVCAFVCVCVRIVKNKKNKAVGDVKDEEQVVFYNYFFNQVAIIYRTGILL